MAFASRVARSGTFVLLESMPISRRRFGVRIGLAAAFLCASGAARAHDQWIWPDTLAVPAPATITLKLFVGDDFVVED